MNVDVDHDEDEDEDGTGSELKVESWVKCPVTYCVRRVKAALVMEEGRLSPLVISRQIFLLITSTKPPRATTKRYSSYRSNTCLAIIGMRLTGEPVCRKRKSKRKKREKRGEKLCW